MHQHYQNIFLVHKCHNNGNSMKQQNAVGGSRLRPIVPGKLNQTTLSDVRLVLPPGKLDKTYASSLILVHMNHCVKT